MVKQWAELVCLAAAGLEWGTKAWKAIVETACDRLWGHCCHAVDFLSTSVPITPFWASVSPSTQ